MSNIDTFEDIAKDAVAALIAAAQTLQLFGDNELGAAIAKAAEECINRAIAIGGE